MTREAGGILFVTDRRFWRRSIGSEQRIASLVRHLAARGLPVAVAYVGRLDRSEKARLDRFRETEPSVDVRSRPGGLASIIAFLRRFGRDRAGPAEGRHTTPPAADPLSGDRSPERRAFVAATIRALRPRVVIVEFLRLGYTVHPRPDGTDADTTWLIDTHDVLHERAARYREQDLPVARALGPEQEARALATFDGILAIQEREGELLRRLLPDHRVIVVPHGLPMPKLAEPAGRPERPLRLGFLGGRDEANRDALDWFVEAVWPALRTARADALELHVAGQVCDGWQRAAPGVVAHGRVESIDRFWPEIDIAINPVRVGSGLKIKNVEALAWGRPLITTPVGAEGLEAAGPEGLCVADRAPEWIEALETWLGDPEARRRVARSGRAWAEEHLSEEAAFGPLCRLLDELGVGRSA